VIVSCRSCQTRFRIADEKVKDRGVKVRCSRCGAVFQVRRDDEPLTAGPDLPWKPGAGSPAPGMPAGDEVSVHDGPTRVAVADSLVGLSAAPDFTPSLGGGRAVPLPPAPPPPPVSPPVADDDPFAGIDPFGDLGAPPAPVAAPPPTPAAAAAIEMPGDEDPFAGLDVGPPRAGPPPLPTRPRGDALLDGPPPPPADDDPFAGLDMPAPAAPDPFSLSNLDDLGPPPAGSLDIDLGLPPSPVPSAVPAAPASTNGKRAVARLSSPDPSLSLRPSRNLQRRRGPGAALSVTGGALLLVALLAGVVMLRTEGDVSSLTVDRALAALGLDPARAAGPDKKPIIASDVITSVYPTASGKSVLVVRGEVQAAQAAPGVRVQVDLLADDRTVARTETWAGKVPSLEDVYAIRGGPDWEELVRRLGRVVGAVQPGKRVPFLAVFPDPPQRLDRTRVRVNAEPAPLPVPAADDTPVAADPGG
jgi:predicted Zn finger-like uncharacterized protein